jgi:hypothetical protein
LRNSIQNDCGAIFVPLPMYSASLLAAGVRDHPWTWLRCFILIFASWNMYSETITEVLCECHVSPPIYSCLAIVILRTFSTVCLKTHRRVPNSIILYIEISLVTTSMQLRHIALKCGLASIIIVIKHPMLYSLNHITIVVDLQLPVYLTENLFQYWTYFASFCLFLN